MSIIIGMLAKNCALVASDGRIISGAKYENGIVTQKSHVTSDEFNKTFTLKNDSIIGVVAGTMEFQGKSISEHIDEILNETCEGEINTFEELLDFISDGLKFKMQNISETEISFQFRIINLILIGYKEKKLSDLSMHAFSFSPNLGTKYIECSKKIVEPVKNNLAQWELFGDVSSQKAVNDFLYERISILKKKTEAKLRSISKNAIELGIKKSTKSASGDHLTCGGKVYIKSIK
ncbi:MAG: hypothetical protein CVV22_05245 [Ignavibacteriae bacterium HGW-Ignavibacteriae-1]|jgi:predicted HicB family RNase H-like nuclease|nr:MAG: hypothetical protein CVV22_05245 [Ignavibacteriae bacterium HGW-Ignavibacteriae-1]